MVFFPSPPPSLENSQFLVMFVVCSFGLLGGIWLLREDHAREIYIIWYMFFLFFVIFCVLHAYARVNNVALKDAFGRQGGEFFASAYDYLTNFEAEVAMVLTIFVLAVVPQWLTYIISGLSGSATPPKFVSQVTDIAMWSLIKFMAALGGVMLAAIIWEGKFHPYRLVEMVTMLGCAFSLVIWRRDSPPFFSKLSRRGYFAKFRSFHKFFTRYNRPTTSTTPTSLDQARLDQASSGAFELALTTGIIQALRCAASSGAFERALTTGIAQALRDAGVTSATTPAGLDRASSGAFERALTTSIVQALRYAASSGAFERALTKVIGQALRDAGVTSAPVNVLNDKNAEQEGPDGTERP